MILSPSEAQFDGKWVLKTNTTLTAQQVALKYKELWNVEHVFCSFLALVLRKEVDHRLEKAGHDFEWANFKQDLKALQEITIEDNSKKLAMGFAARPFRLSALRSLSPSGRYNEAYPILKEQFVVPRTFCEYLSN